MSMKYLFCLVLLTLAADTHAQSASPAPPSFPSAAVTLVREFYGGEGVEMTREFARLFDPIINPFRIAMSPQRIVATDCKFRAFWQLNQNDSEFVAITRQSGQIAIALCDHSELTDEMMEGAKNIQREIVEKFIADKYKASLPIRSVVIEPDMKADYWSVFQFAYGHGFGLLPTLVLTNSERRVVVMYFDQTLECWIPDCPATYEKALGLAKRLIALDWNAP